MVDVARSVNGIVQPSGETGRVWVADFWNRGAGAERDDAERPGLWEEASGFEDGDSGRVVARNGAVNQTDFGVDARRRV